LFDSKRLRELHGPHFITSRPPERSSPPRSSCSASVPLLGSIDRRWRAVFTRRPVPPGPGRFRGNAATDHSPWTVAHRGGTGVYAGPSACPRTGRQLGRHEIRARRAPCETPRWACSIQGATGTGAPAICFVPVVPTQELVSPALAGTCPTGNFQRRLV